MKEGKPLLTERFVSLVENRWNETHQTLLAFVWLLNQVNRNHRITIKTEQKTAKPKK